MDRPGEPLNQPTGRGRGWHGDSLRHAEAGRKGGLKTARSGKLALAAKEGGFKTSEAYDMAEIGSLGGRAKYRNARRRYELANSGVLPMPDGR